MQNKFGKLFGFFAGAGGFVFLFRMLFLNSVAPSDELAPAIVVISAMAFGIIVACVGGYAQGVIKRKISGTHKKGLYKNKKVTI